MTHNVAIGMLFFCLTLLVQLPTIKTDWLMNRVID